MTAWTTPKTWNNETVTDTDLATYVRDNTNHLYENKPFTLIPGLEGSADVAGVGGAGTSQEWSTSTTGLTWTPSSPTTVNSDTTIPSFLYLLNQSDSVERLGLKTWSAAGAFDARLGGIILGSNTSVSAVAPIVGLMITDSGNNNRALVQVSYTLNTGASTVSAFTYAASTYTQRGSNLTVPTVPMYLRITRDGSNNVSFYWSTNGVLWNFIATQSFTFTVANIGLRVQAVSVASEVAIDWLRTSV